MRVLTMSMPINCSSVYCGFGLVLSLFSPKTNYMYLIVTSTVAQKMLEIDFIYNLKSDGTLQKQCSYCYCCSASG